MTRIAIGIDPALDLTGVALMRWPAGLRVPVVAYTASIRTAPATRFAERLADIAGKVIAQLNKAQVYLVNEAAVTVTVCIEVPEYWGTHQKILRNGRTMNVGREQLAD